MENVTLAIESQPPVIRQLLDASEVSTSPDGVVSYFLVRPVDAAIKEQVEAAASVILPSIERYSRNGQDFSWNAWIGMDKSTNRLLYFTFVDYTNFRR